MLYVIVFCYCFSINRVLKMSPYWSVIRTLIAINVKEMTRAGL